MALNLAKVVIGYLKDRPEEKFSARQIAEWVGNPPTFSGQQKWS